MFVHIKIKRWCDRQTFTALAFLSVRSHTGTNRKQPSFPTFPTCHCQIFTFDVVHCNTSLFWPSSLNSLLYTTLKIPYFNLQLCLLIFYILQNTCVVLRPRLHYQCYYFTYKYWLDFMHRIVMWFFLDCYFMFQSGISKLSHKSINIL